MLIGDTIIKVDNPNVLLFHVFNNEKIVDLNIKKNSYPSIEADKEIQNILLQYKKKKYIVGISVSGDESPESIMTKILEYEIEKLMKANARVPKK